jgi:hypothetical protein
MEHVANTRLPYVWGKVKLNLPTPTMSYQHSTFKLNMVYKCHQSLHVKLERNRLSACWLVASSVADPIKRINFMALREKPRYNLHEGTY